MNNKQKILTVLAVVVIGGIGFNYCFVEYRREFSGYAAGLLFIGIIYAGLFFVLKSAVSKEPLQAAMVSAVPPTSQTPALDRSEQNVDRASKKAAHWNIGWPLLIVGSLSLCVVYLFAVDRRFSESLSSGPVESLGHVSAAIILIPIGASLGIPFWICAWILKQRERVSFKPFVLVGMASSIILLFAGKQFGKSQTETEKQADLSSLQLHDARLSYVESRNSLVAKYRTRVPNDPRSDDELTLLFGKIHDEDMRYWEHPDFVADYQRLKQGSNYRFFNRMNGRVKNNGRKKLSSLKLEIVIVGSNDAPVNTYSLTLYPNISPGETEPFSESVFIVGVPLEFKWSYKFVDASFF